MSKKLILLVVAIIAIGIGILVTNIFQVYHRNFVGSEEALQPDLGSCRVYEASSPDGNLVVNFCLREKPYPNPEGEMPYYSVSYKGKTIILNSALGVEFEKGVLAKNLRVVGVKRKAVNEAWNPPWGTEKEIINHYNELRVLLRERNSPFKEMTLTFRAYDDGVAFRYAFPGQRHEKFTILEEHTQFHLPEGCICWTQRINAFPTSYEEEYEKTLLKDIKPDSIVSLPLLIKSKEGIWIAVTEAGLKDYSGMFLSRVRSFPYALESKLSPLGEVEKRKVTGQFPAQTPWRVMMVSARLGGLIESNIIQNLNEGSKIKDTSWIKPGKVTWPWWSGRAVKKQGVEGGMNTPTMKHYVDFAARNGIEYLLIDAGWYCPEGEAWEHPLIQNLTHMEEGIDVREVIDYAKPKGVGVILWMHGFTLEKQIDWILPIFEEWGVSGIKVDFPGGEHQGLVDFYWEVAEKAAKHKLVVDFHGAYKPTGIRRTYPNVLTREGVKGLEWDMPWGGSGIGLEHEVTLPFTRMLVGPMDFTPGAFAPEHFKSPWNVKGTRTRQLAMYVVYESPLQMLVDYPAAYEGKRGFEFIKEVPTTWDKTRVIGGEVGDYVVIARMHGGEWWIGAMTDENQRELSFSLDFLEKGTWEAYIWEDESKAAKDPTSIQLRKERVTPQSQIRVQLAPGGGLAIRIIPV